jgi:tRNA threonylcarbamoyladenosine biosynthesis protein TsaB
VRILAIETTENVGSLAAFDNSNLIAEIDLEQKQRSAQSLAPALKNLLEKLGWRAADLNLVAVTIGPGSFTGLRVGLTAAKTLAYVAGADILGVDTLHTIALAAPPEVDAIAVAVDAQRGDVVAGLFRRGADGWFDSVGAETLLSADEWLAGLPTGIAVTGPILAKHLDRLPPGVQTLASACWRPTAVNAGRLAIRLHAAGRRDDLWSLAPRYSRPSAAEEKWAGRAKPNRP